MDPARFSVPSACGEAARTQRPWGWYETLAQGDGYLVKRLRLYAGRRLSLQRHSHRCEHWLVVAGDGSIQSDQLLLPARAGVSLFIPVGGMHRASAGSSDLEIIEVQRGDLLCEDDIERFEDDFGRVVNSVVNL